jgi:putative ABC transport system permease protein
LILVTLRDLQHRSTRVVVVTVLVALVLTLLFLMTGLVNQLNTEPFRAVGVVDRSHWVVAEGVSGPFTSVSTLPATLADEVPGSTPVVVSRGTLVDESGADTEIVLLGVTPDGPSPRLVEGTAASGPGEVVLDESAGVAVGETVGIGTTQQTVVGLTEDATVLAGLPFVFVDLELAQQLSFDTTAVVSALLVDGDPGAVEGATVRTAEAVAEDALGPLESAVASIDLIRALLWTVAAIVVGAVVYLSALERQRDFAVMKAVGASGRDLAGGMALQAVVVALVSALVAGVLAWLVEPVFPLRVVVPAEAYWQVPLVAVVIGLFAASFGARRANRTDPAEAFGGAA